MRPKVGGGQSCRFLAVSICISIALLVLLVHKDLQTDLLPWSKSFLTDDVTTTTADRYLVDQTESSSFTPLLQSSSSSLPSSTVRNENGKVVILVHIASNMYTRSWTTVHKTWLSSVPSWATVILYSLDRECPPSFPCDEIFLIEVGETYFWDVNPTAELTLIALEHAVTTHKVPYYLKVNADIFVNWNGLKKTLSQYHQKNFDIKAPQYIGDCSCRFTWEESDGDRYILYACDSTGILLNAIAAQSLIAHEKSKGCPRESLIDGAGRIPRLKLHFDREQFPPLPGSRSPTILSTSTSNNLIYLTI